MSKQSIYTQELPLGGVSLDQIEQRIRDVLIITILVNTPTKKPAFFLPDSVASDLVCVFAIHPYLDDLDQSDQPPAIVISIRYGETRSLILEVTADDGVQESVLPNTIAVAKMVGSQIKKIIHL